MNHSSLAELVHEKGLKKTIKKDNMEIEQYIATFQNVLDDDTCDKWVKWFDEVSNKDVTMTSYDEIGVRKNNRKDEVVSIPQSLPMDCFPQKKLVEPLWNKVSKCLDMYVEEFQLEQQLTSNYFKVHRVLPTGGYHVWHYEHMAQCPYRVLVWHITIEAPESGGETEFLFQSMRIKPILGQLVVWPAAFTHKHRGNPTLKGKKTYITGWFEFK